MPTIWTSLATSPAGNLAVGYSSGSPPASLVIVGVPQASASIATRGAGSGQSEGTMTAVDAAHQIEHLVMGACGRQYSTRPLSGLLNLASERSVADDARSAPPYPCAARPPGAS